LVNPYRHSYEAIIVNDIVEKSVDAYNEMCKKSEEGLDFGTEIVDGIKGFEMIQVPQSATELQHVIQKKGFPKADYKIVRGRINKLVKQHNLEEVPGKRYRNVKRYKMSKEKLVKCLLRLEDTRQQLALADPEIIQKFRLPIFYTHTRGTFQIKLLPPLTQVSKK